MAVEFKEIPLGDLIVVEMAATPRDQRILLPDWARNLEGTVVAVGSGAPLPGGATTPMMTRVGDRVVFSAAVGMESYYEGVSVRIMRDTDVDAVLGGDDAVAA